ncbi:MAG: hypothetical protein KJZ69_18385 [Phycisphaerales bacterium]|nr:hypothetical protein [Phycisphaerales bacterium]
MKRLIPIALLFLLPACGVNEWEMSYQTLSEERFAPLREDATLDVVDCSTFADSLYVEKVEAAEENARSLGYSRFEINRTRGAGSTIQAEYRGDLEAFARSIGADFVLFRIVYVDTQRARELESWDIPRTDTHYLTTTTRNSDGSRTRSTTTITTTNWETRLITRTVNIDRFTASAAYFRREPDPD